MIQALEITRYYAETPFNVNYDKSFRMWEGLLVDNSADLARGQISVEMPFVKHNKELGMEMEIDWKAMGNWIHTYCFLTTRKWP